MAATNGLSSSPESMDLGKMRWIYNFYFVRVSTRRFPSRHKHRRARGLVGCRGGRRKLEGEKEWNQGGWHGGGFGGLDFRDLVMLGLDLGVWSSQVLRMEVSMWKVAFSDWVKRLASDGEDSSHGSRY